MPAADGISGHTDDLSCCRREQLYVPLFCPSFHNCGCQFQMFGREVQKYSLIKQACLMALMRGWLRGASNINIGLAATVVASLPYKSLLPRGWLELLSLYHTLS